MSSFTAPLLLEALPTVRSGRGEFLTYAPFTYDVGYKGSGDTITIPAGFRTDLCSVPFFARPFVPLAGPAAKPALVHDWLVEQEDPRANAIFDEALGVANVGNVMRKAMVLAVTIWLPIRRLIQRVAFTYQPM